MLHLKKNNKYISNLLEENNIPNSGKWKGPPISIRKYSNTYPCIVLSSFSGSEVSHLKND